jgi:hypothetical protein
VGFYKDQLSAYERHVVKCVHANVEKIEAERPSVKNPLLYGIWDKELEAWMGKHREALLEDRKRL